VAFFHRVLIKGSHNSHVDSNKSINKSINFQILVVDRPWERAKGKRLLAAITLQEKLKSG
jgi:hypothetical protein